MSSANRISPHPHLDSDRRRFPAAALGASCSGCRCGFPECLIHGVGSAEEALAHAGASRTDVVLMDIDLPGMNGLEAVAQLKPCRPRLRS